MQPYSALIDYNIAPDYFRITKHPMSDNQLFKIIFRHHQDVYELYAKHVYDSDMPGFIAIESIQFGGKSDILVDPSEEQLKSEFKDVTRTFVPTHHVIRVDQVKQRGANKIRSGDTNGAKVTSLPGAT